MIFENLPESILVDVLVRLPFESLVRFRCVSKSWRDLIDTRFVTDMHYSTRTRPLINTHPHPDSRIISLVYGRFRGTRVYAIGPVESKQENGTAEYEVDAKQLGSPCSEEFFEQSFGFVGSCNGILCFCQGSRYELFLWNPFTRSYFELPPPPPLDEFHYNDESLFATFGYHDDYKIVKYHRVYIRGFQFCVYSLKHKSWTRTMRAAIPFEISSKNYYIGTTTSVNVVANGALHWLAHGFILAFDPATNEFRKLPSCPRPSPSKLYCVDGFLMLVCYDFEFVVTDIWMMEDYGVSWTKLAPIDARHEAYITYTPLAFLKGRKKLLFEIRGKLEVFDFETKSFSEVVINDVANHSRLCGGPHDKYHVCVGSFATPTNST